MRYLGLERFSGLYLWAIFILTFGIWEPGLFLTSATLHSVASEQAVAAMLALAVLVPLVAGAYDLSVGSVINMSAITCVWLQTAEGWSMWASIGLAVGISALVGVVNAFIVVKLQVSSFIATLGMATIVAAVQTIVSGANQPLPPTASSWLNLTQRTFGGFQVIVWYLLILALVLWWFLEMTPGGRYMQATGGNIEAARLSGVATGFWTAIALVISAVISGAAGVLYASLSGPALSFGPGLLLPAFAAVFLGSTQLRPGRFNVWGTVLAVYVLATGVTGFEYVTGAQWLNDMFNGVALIVAVAFAGWRLRARVSSTRVRTALETEPDATEIVTDAADGSVDEDSPRPPRRRR